MTRIVLALVSLQGLACGDIEVASEQCAPGARRCRSDMRAVESCLADGHGFGFLEECAAGQACDGGVCGQPAGTDSGGACGAVTDAGCCDGKTLKFCTGGVLAVHACERCGWVAADGYYGCDADGSDPSGKAPRDCTN